jgi:flavodoxin
MKAVVVYESLWGNTAAVARAVAEGLVSRFADSSGLANGLGQDLVGGLDPGEWR